jgi:hypothetical protein
VAPALRTHPRAPAPGGRAGVARVPQVWNRLPWLRPALVRNVPDERAVPFLLSRQVLLPVVREEAPAPVGGVAAEGSARARSASSCRPHHAAPPARDLPQAPGASPRPRAMRRRGRRRVREEAARGARSARHRRVDRDKRRSRPVASPRTPSTDRRWLLGRRRVSSPPGLGGGGGHEAVPRTSSGAPDRATRNLGEDKKAIEDVACYVVRSALSLKKLVYLDGQKAVLYRSRMNPSLGRNFEAMDPLEWLARLADHISRSLPTSPTASRSARSWTISTSARWRSHLLLTSERSSVCRWTTRVEKSRPPQLDTPISKRDRHLGSGVVSPSRAGQGSPTHRQPKTGRLISYRRSRMPDGRVGGVPSLSAMSPATVDRGFTALSVERRLASGRRLVSGA